MTSPTAWEPVATIVVPARNEMRDIQGCIEALGRQDLPLGDLEVLVIDGGSEDGTANAAQHALDRFGFGRARVLASPAGATPSNLNTGLAAARGPVLCRVDARSVVPPDYVRRCVAALDDHPERSVVGGGQQARPRSGRTVDVGIARALNNRWSMGLSKYRRGGPSGPADTVYLGAFRTDELRSVAGWDERFGTNQDFDLNRRMARIGQVWFLGDLSVGYLPREDHRSLFLQYRRFGAAKVAYWRETGDRPRPRQVLALSGLPVAAAAAAIWLGSPRSRQIGAIVVAAVAAASVEETGTTGPRGGPAVRAASLAAIACTVCGWSIGVWSALARRRRR